MRAVVRKLACIFGAVGELDDGRLELGLQLVGRFWCAILLILGLQVSLYDLCWRQCVLEDTFRSQVYMCCDWINLTVATGWYVDISWVACTGRLFLEVSDLKFGDCRWITCVVRFVWGDSLF